MFSTHKPTGRLRPFLRGMGSILEIWPPPGRIHELLPTETPAEALARYRSSVEGYLSGAIGRFEIEQGIKPNEREAPKPQQESAA